jgi:hypothetical protein
MLYKRALFTNEFDKMLREGEQRILKDPKMRMDYKLEERGNEGSTVVNVNLGTTGRDTWFVV